jgi:hypothetical protein
MVLGIYGKSQLWPYVNSALLGINTADKIRTPTLNFRTSANSSGPDPKSQKDRQTGHPQKE